jgi:hypothetical protein
VPRSYADSRAPWARRELAPPATSVGDRPHSRTERSSRPLCQYGASFALDGNLIGDLGEALANEYFGVRLVERNGAGINGYARDGRIIQVKASATGRGAAFRNTETRAVRELL